MVFQEGSYGGQTTNKNIVLSNNTSASFIQKLLPSAKKISRSGSVGAGTTQLYSVPQNKYFILTYANMHTANSSVAGGAPYWWICALTATEGAETNNLFYHTEYSDYVTAFQTSLQEINSSYPMVYSAGSVFSVVSNATRENVAISTITGFEIDKYEWENYLYKSN